MSEHGRFSRLQNVCIMILFLSHSHLETDGHKDIGIFGVIHNLHARVERQVQRTKAFPKVTGQEDPGSTASRHISCKDHLEIKAKFK